MIHLHLLLFEKIFAKKNVFNDALQLFRVRYNRGLFPKDQFVKKKANQIFLLGFCEGIVGA